MRFFLSMVALSSLVFAVDLNKADVKELESLNGVGSKKALAIVEYREKNGCFKSIEELKKIKGINDVIINKNKDSITITPCE